MNWTAMLRSVWGCLLAVLPGPLLRATGGDSIPAARLVLRILGAREVAQGVVTAAKPVEEVLVPGSVVDLSHAATALLCAAATPRWRRIALVSAAVSTALGVHGLVAARR